MREKYLYALSQKIEFFPKISLFITREKDKNVWKDF